MAFLFSNSLEPFTIFLFITWHTFMTSTTVRTKAKRISKHVKGCLGWKVSDIYSDFIFGIYRAFYPWCVIFVKSGEPFKRYCILQMRSKAGMENLY